MGMTAMNGTDGTIDEDMDDDASAKSEEMAMAQDNAAVNKDDEEATVGPDDFEECTGHPSSESYSNRNTGSNYFDTTEETMMTDDMAEPEVNDTSVVARQHGQSSASEYTTNQSG
jgi:hypothetical protein